MKPIIESIREANDESAIRFYLNYGNELHPSGRLRRRWLTAARIRREQLLNDKAKGRILI